MKRYLFTLLLVACAGACSRNSRPSETADNRDNRDSAHLYSATETTVVADDPAREVTPPEHRTSDEIASTGEGLPDTTRPRSSATVPSETGAPASDLSPSPRESTPAPGMSQPDSTRTPDNTGVNERDRHGSTLTPMDQGESDADIKLTQDIRRAIVDNDKLSFSAKNVKIITRNGKVTLRGTVPSTRERTLIQDAAKTRAGVSSVDNQLEVSNK